MTTKLTSILFCVALLCGGLYGEVDIEALKKKAEAGDAEAQFKLAYYYFEKRGISLPLDKDPNLLEALKRFTKLAEQGHDPSRFFLGIFYCTGFGVEKDLERGKALMRTAAEGGKAAIQYEYGRHVIEEDPNEAFKWILKAAQKGHLEAEYKVAKMYHYGRGVEKSRVEAWKWYNKSANKGYVPSLYALGLMHAESGVENDELAYAYFILCKEKGLKEVERAFRYLGEKLTPAQIKEAKKLAKEIQAKIDANKANQ